MEKVFLDDSWGIRDVRGPYLAKVPGLIRINSKLLSATIPSTISFVFSLSNVCPAPLISFEVSTIDKKTRTKLKRNNSVDVVFESITNKNNEDVEFFVYSPELVNKLSANEFMEVVAIDELTIERSSCSGAQ